MFKKMLLLSLLVPFMAQALEITNNSSKTLYFFVSEFISGIEPAVFFSLAAKTSREETDIAALSVYYSSQNNNISEDNYINYIYSNATDKISFSIDNLADSSKITFIEEDGKISVMHELNGQKMKINDIDSKKESEQVSKS